MEISNAKSMDTLWPTETGIEIVDDSPCPCWEVDLMAKYFKDDKLTISEEAYAKIRGEAHKDYLDNQMYPSWFRELSIDAINEQNSQAGIDLMNAFTFAVRLSADRFRDENRIHENEYGQRELKSYMIEDDEILKEQFYTAIMEKTTAGKAILEQHLAGKEALSKGPQPTVDINNSQDFALRMYQPI